VHTLPLPEMHTDVNPDSKLNPSSTWESANPPMPIGAESEGSETGDVAPGTGASTGSTLILKADLRPSEPRIAIPESQNPGLEARTPLRDPSPGLRLPALPPPLPWFSHLTPQQLQFLSQVTSAAMESQREEQIPASVTIAQAILESATAAGWGSSPLFRLANNPFGIKYCHFAPVDRKLDQPVPEGYGAFDALTWEIENGEKKFILAQFQRFPNLHEAFAAHAQLLRGPRYRPAYAVRGDWKKFAERLGPKPSPLDTEHCGYSTNPSYSAELIKLVSLYGLDDPGALESYARGQEPVAGNGARETAPLHSERDGEQVPGNLTSNPQKGISTT
jgi:flagellum-specific peptidoglycan hydrolase FlgJ